MKKNNLIFGLIGLVIYIAIIISSYYVFNTNIPITLYSNNDYVSKYAKKHMLNHYSISESELNDYILNIEEFEYKKVDNNISLTKYNGISSNLIIPKSIDGMKVTTIENSLFENTNVKEITISSNITKINATDLNVVIYCYDNDYCNELKDNNYNVSIMNDSEVVNFNNTTNMFGYNLNNNKIELKNYLGNDSIVIIPTRINGYEVTKISFDSTIITNIYIPNTVESISNGFLSAFLFKYFLTIFVCMTIAFVSYLVIVFTNKNRNLNDSSKNTIIYIVSILYLLILSYLAIKLASFDLLNKVFILCFILITLFYILISILLKIEKSNSNKYEEKVKTSFVQNALNLLSKNDSNNEYGLNELIKYSDPVSINEVESIENKIMELLNSLNNDNAILIRNLINERNNIIKNNK